MISLRGPANYIIRAFNSLSGFTNVRNILYLYLRLLIGLIGLISTVTRDLHNYDKLSRVYFKDYKSINLSKYCFDHLSSHSFICLFTYWLFLFQLRDP